jgi:hypothetical protein
MEPLPDGVYLLSSAADTAISRIIRFGMGAEHGHLTVILMEDGLIKAYSFARRRWSTPIDGRFIEEGRERYTVEGGHCSSLALFAIPDDAAATVRHRLPRFRPLMEASLYNLPDAVANTFGVRIPSTKAQTCVSFCALMLGLERRRDVVRLREVLTAAGAKMVYRGSLLGLEEFTGRRFWDGDSEFYSHRLPKPVALATVISSQAKSIGRIAAEYAAGHQPRLEPRPHGRAARQLWAKLKRSRRGPLARLRGRRADSPDRPPASGLRWHWRA